MSGGSIVALSISGLALLVAIYGAWERHSTARRLERLRFASIVDELNTLHLEQVKAPDGVDRDEFSAAVNSRRELLSMQALSLLPRFRREIISSELRALAYALKQSGYHADADRIWNRAVEAATGEGATQALYAHRGYAYFLFSVGRPAEGRVRMRMAIESVGQDDHSLVNRIETLRYWSNEERAAPQPGAPTAEELLAEARVLADSITSARIRERVIEELGRAAQDG